MRILLLVAVALPACKPDHYTIDASPGGTINPNPCAMQFTGGGFGDYACQVTLENGAMQVAALMFPSTSYPGSATLRATLYGAPLLITYGSTWDAGGGHVVMGEGASQTEWIADTWEITLVSVTPMKVGGATSYVLDGSFDASLSKYPSGDSPISFIGHF